jgi:hypothetical protein
MQASLPIEVVGAVALLSMDREVGKRSRSVAMDKLPVMWGPDLCSPARARKISR